MLAWVAITALPRSFCSLFHNFSPYFLDFVRWARGFVVCGGCGGFGRLRSSLLCTFTSFPHSVLPNSIHLSSKISKKFLKNPKQIRKKSCEPLCDWIHTLITRWKCLGRPQRWNAQNCKGRGKGKGWDSVWTNLQKESYSKRETIPPN